MGHTAELLLSRGESGKWLTIEYFLRFYAKVKGGVSLTLVKRGCYIAWSFSALNSSLYR
jgi:hypothetical protein